MKNNNRRQKTCIPGHYHHVSILCLGFVFKKNATTNKEKKGKEKGCFTPLKFKNIFITSKAMARFDDLLLLFTCLLGIGFLITAISVKDSFLFRYFGLGSKSAPSSLAALSATASSSSSPASSKTSAPVRTAEQLRGAAVAAAKTVDDLVVNQSNVDAWKAEQQEALLVFWNPQCFHCHQYQPVALEMMKGLATQYPSLHCGFVLARENAALFAEARIPGTPAVVFLDSAGKMHFLEDRSPRSVQQRVAALHKSSQ